jgi:hypothetical protein
MMVDLRKLAELVVQEFYRRHRYQLRKAPFLDYKGTFRKDMPRTARATVDRDIELIEGLLRKVAAEAARQGATSRFEEAPVSAAEKVGGVEVSKGIPGEKMTRVEKGGGQNCKGIGPMVQLLKEKRADGSSLNMWAYLDSEGCLHIDGQDLGPVTKAVSDDGEYEYFYTIPAEDIPALVKVLGGKVGDNVLDVIKKKWSGKKSYDLGELLDKSQVRVKFSTWSG